MSDDMGKSGKQQRRKAFADYQITSILLSQAKKDAILMHPLPPPREEVAENIIY